MNAALEPLEAVSFERDAGRLHMLGSFRDASGGLSQLEFRGYIAAEWVSAADMHFLPHFLPHFLSGVDSDSSGFGLETRWNPGGWRVRHVGHKCGFTGRPTRF